MCCQIMVVNGVDLGIRDHDGFAAADLAEYNGHPQCAKYLRTVEHMSVEHRVLSRTLHRPEYKQPDSGLVLGPTPPCPPSTPRPRFDLGSPSSSLSNYDSANSSQTSTGEKRGGAPPAPPAPTTLPGGSATAITNMQAYMDMLNPEIRGPPCPSPSPSHAAARLPGPPAPVRGPGTAVPEGFGFCRVPEDQEQPAARENDKRQDHWRGGFVEGDYVLTPR
ncbi:unnamed protein product [Arctogadus glacialis]